MKKLMMMLGLVAVFAIAGCSTEQAEQVTRLLGEPDAKVKIVEYSDLECPACGAFHKGSFKEIKANYIDTGLVSFELRDFPLPMHEDAFPAAKAAHCAGDQGQYFEFAQMVYEGQPDLSDDALDGYAEELGLDIALFDECRSSTKYNKIINGNVARGRADEVNATPTIFVNDIKLQGAQPFEVFQKIIDQELAK